MWVNPSRMSTKEFQNELYALGGKLWLKLEGLRKAEPWEIVLFFFIILFIVTVLSIMVTACTVCCDHSYTRSKPRRIQVRPAD